MNQIVGAAGAANVPYTGGYGAATGGALVSGPQAGGNSVNAVAASVQDGASVALSQLPGAPAATGVIGQGGVLNMSVVNTMLGYTNAGPANAGGAGSAQTATNSFNSATLSGSGITLGAQQLADGLNSSQTGLQSINRALAFSAGTTLANLDPSVTNLTQTGGVAVNTLGVTDQSGATLTGVQSLAGAAGLPLPILTNQAVASTVEGGGFTADGTNAGWVGFAATVAAGMPAPASYSGVAPLVQAGGVYAGMGNAVVSTLGQSLGLATNITTVTSPAVRFGATGYAQSIGNLNLVGPAYPNAVGGDGGQNNALAETGAGSAGLAQVTQGFGTSANVFNASGAVSGTLTQTATSIDFGGATYASPSLAPGLAVVTPNAGAGLPEGAGGAGPYSVYAASNPVTTTPVWNSAVASTSYGAATAVGVGQQMTAALNSLAAAGPISSGAAGTVTQNLGVLGIDCACTAGQGAPAAQQVSVQSLAAGAASASGIGQSLTVHGNAIQSGAGIDGSVAQIGQSGIAAGNSANAFNPSNGIAVGSYGQGVATLSGAAQSDTVMMNTLSAAGDLGSATAPAAFSQSSGGMGATVGTTARAVSASGAMGAAVAPLAVPWNAASVTATGGAGGAAAASGLTQTAGLLTNQIAGGALSGNVTQASTGQASGVGNSAAVYAVTSPAGPPSLALAAYPTVAGLGSVAAYGTNGLAASGVASGSAQLGGLAQSVAQGVNGLTLASANGSLNQATFAATALGTGNQALVQANRGFATAWGTQVAQNALNTVASH